MTLRMRCAEVFLDPYRKIINNEAIYREMLKLTLEYMPKFTLEYMPKFTLEYMRKSGREADPSPPSNSEVKKRAELYLYSP